MTIRLDYGIMYNMLLSTRLRIPSIFLCMCSFVEIEEAAAHDNNIFVNVIACELELVHLQLS